MTDDEIRRLLAEVAEAAEREKDEPSYWVRKKPGRPPAVAREKGEVYSVRIPAGRLDQFRKVAAKRGKAPTALMREWVIERLDRELKGGRRPKARRPGRGTS
jgi:hypothetical protein